MKSLKILSVVAVAFLSTACGGKAIKSKEDAAAAYQRVAAAAYGAQPTTQMGMNALGELTMTVSGQEGTATITMLTPDENAPIGAFAMSVTYDGYSVDGENVIDGTIKITMTIGGLDTIDPENPGSFAITVNMTMEGNVTLDGEYSGDLKFAMTTTTSASDLQNQNGATVKMTMNGWIEADGSRYEFANETVEVKAYEG